MDTALDMDMENKRYEKIDGTIYAMAAPTKNHQIISGNIFGMFFTFLKGKKCQPYNGTEVWLNENNYYIPDVLILCDQDKFHDDGIHGAPDLVVEILSPSTAQKDWGIKKEMYERYGVKEYWIVDPVSKSIVVHHLVNKRFTVAGVYFHRTQEELNHLTRDDKKFIFPSFTTSLFANDLIINLADVFSNVR